MNINARGCRLGLLFFYRTTKLGLFFEKGSKMGKKWQNSRGYADLSREGSFDPIIEKVRISFPNNREKKYICIEQKRLSDR